MADGKITFDTSIDQSGLKNDLKGVKSSLSGLKNMFAGIGKAAIAAFSVGAIINFGKECVTLGSNVAEVQNVVDTAFGDMAYKVEDFAKNSIRNFGMSQLSAKKTASTYMAMAKGMNMEEEAASNMAISLTGLTGDVASFYNISQELADTKLKSIFTGETETLKDLGVVMTQTNLNAYAMANGFGKTVDKMTQAEAVQLRYAYVTDQLRLASGDFIKTQDSWANQTRILSEQFKQLMSVIGQGLIQVLTPCVKVLNQIVAYLIDVANAASAAMTALFGGEQKTYKQTAASIAEATENQEDLTAATEKTAKAAKNATLGFDELNTISQDGGENGTTDAVKSIYSGIGQSEDKNSSESEGQLYKLSSWLSKINFDPAISSFEKAYRSGKKILGLGWNTLGWFYNNVLVPLGEFAIEETIPRFIDSLSGALEVFSTVYEKAEPTLRSFYEKYLRPNIEKQLKSLTKKLDIFNDTLNDLGDILSETSMFEDLWTILDAICGALEESGSLKREFLSDVGSSALVVVFTDFKYLLIDIEDALGLVAALIKGDLKDAWVHFKDLLFENDADKSRELLDDLIGVWKEKIVQWWNEEVAPWFTAEKWENLLKEVGVSTGNAVKMMRDTWNEKIVKWWDEDVSPWFTKEKWLELFSKISKSISDWWDNDITPWFTAERWEQFGEDMSEGLSSGFSKARNAIANILNKIINLVQKAINGLIKGANWFIEGYNSVPGLSDLSPLQYVDLSRYRIPLLAQGAVIPPNREFLAVLGDQKQGTNIETPLDTMIQAFKTALAEGGYGGSGDTVVNLTAMLDGEVIYRNQERVRQKRGTQTVLSGNFAR